MITRNYATAKIVLNRAEESTIGTIDIYGQIGSDWFSNGVDPLEFKQDLANLGEDLDILEVRIHSYGGYVYEGQAIKTALRRHKAKKHIFVDGMAASMASVILMEGDRRYCAKNGTIMIHDPLGICIGNLSQMQKYAATLEQIKEQILDDYAERSNLERDEISKLMTDETHMNAEEALEWGFIDEIGDEIQFNEDDHVVDIAGFTASSKQEGEEGGLRIAANSYLNKIAPILGQLKLSGSPEQSKKEEPTMITDDEKKSVLAGATANDVPESVRNEIAANARADEATRSAAIGEMSQPGAEQTVKDCLADSTCSVGDAAIKVQAAVKSHNQTAADTSQQARETDANRIIREEAETLDIKDGGEKLEADDYEGHYKANVDGCADEFKNLEQYSAYKRGIASNAVRHTAHGLD